MSEIIKHGDNGNDGEKTIQVGDGLQPISIKTYQDIYHQVTGRTEQIQQRHSNNLLIEFHDLEQLHSKVTQLCSVHNVAAQNEVISVFYEKERKEQFTSFDRFRAYNKNAASPTVNIVLKYNFSIIPAGLSRPQEYIVTIRLSSRVALIQKMENDAPSFMRGRIASYIVDNVAEITIEYADYVIARGFLEAFGEWIKGCKATPKRKWLITLRRWSHLIPHGMRIGVVLLLGMFAVQAIPEFFGASLYADRGARFIVIYGAAAYILISLGSAIGEIIENAIDCYPELSYLKLNRGDEKLIAEFQDRKVMVYLKLFGSAFFSILLGIVAAKLEKLI